MTEIQTIWENKQKFRRQLSQRPIAEKLAMLDQMRERHLTLISASKASSVERK